MIGHVSHKYNSDNVFAVLEMFRKQMIPQSAIAQWEELAIELGFSYADTDTIAENATKKGVEKCSREMLRRWKETCQDPTPEKLIKALQVIGQKRYAAQLQSGQ